MTAPLHHRTGVVPGDFHPVSDSGVSEAVAGEAVCLAVVELGVFAGLATGPRYCVIVGRRRGSCEQVAVACETVTDTSLHNLMDAAPQRYIALVLSLCGFESNETELKSPLRTLRDS